MLDPTRLLVASTSNFGAPLARADWAPGAVLSIATEPSPVAGGAGGLRRGRVLGQRRLGGAVQLYTAQAPGVPQPDIPRRRHRRDAGGVRPLGISVNNAFGRPWFANAPLAGGAGTGIETVLDPDGRPLADPPSERAGGVFAGALTNRAPQRARREAARRGGRQRAARRVARRLQPGGLRRRHR